MLRKLSVVVCTKDRHESLDRCLKSLKKQTYKDFELLVVSTPSEKSKEICKKHGANYIEEEKKGRCVARNTGIMKSNGEIIVFLDDDTEAENDCVGKILECYTSESIGSVGGNENNPRNPAKLNVFQKAKNFILRDVNPFLRIKKMDVRNSGRVTGSFKENMGKITEAKHVKGSVMSFRKKALLSIRGFDTWFDKTSHREETDVCVRLRKKGYRILYNPYAKVVHHSENQGREGRFDFLYNNYKQHQYFVFKNNLIRFSGLPEYALGELLEILALFIYVLFEKDFMYLLLIKAKLEGISEGIKARYKKGIYGDIRL
ncbi:MAG: glycosyltransferase [Candidatus Aenigmarchaeota archaeon]|nr:glycosyltransferase [Candidatus Aenigmarchaeota archaeon]